MAYQKLAILASKLHQRTVEGRIDWELTTIDGIYQASFANYSVRISVQPSRETEDDDVKIVVLDDQGLEMESFLDVDFDRVEFQETAGAGSSAYKIMKDTYDSARRVALGSERAINEILADLDDDGIPF